MEAGPGNSLAAYSAHSWMTSFETSGASPIRAERGASPMPRALDRLPFKGPWQGRNDLVSQKQVPLGQFTDCVNTMGYAGRIGPRWGYSQTRADSFVFAPLALTTMGVAFTSTHTSHVRVNPATGYIYFLNNDKEVWRILKDGTNKTM